MQILAKKPVSPRILPVVTGVVGSEQGRSVPLQWDPEVGLEICTH